MAVMPSVEIRGLDETEAMLKALPEQLEKAGTRGLLKAGQQVAKFWKLALSGPRSAHRLGVITGTSRRSIRTKKIDKDTVRVGTDQEHLMAYEFGFRGRVTVRRHLVRSHSRGGVQVPAHSRGPFSRQMNIAKKPHRAPAVKLSFPIVEKILAGEVDEAVRMSKKLGKRVRTLQRAGAGR